MPSKSNNYFQAHTQIHTLDLVTLCKRLSEYLDMFLFYPLTFFCANNNLLPFTSTSCSMILGDPGFNNLNLVIHVS